MESSIGAVDTFLSGLSVITFMCSSEPSWPIIHIGDEIEQLSGYPAAYFFEDGHRSFGSIIYEEDRLPVARIVENAIDTHQPYEIEYRIHTAAGHLVWVFEKGKCAYDKNELPQYLSGIIIDIASQKWRIDELTESRKKYKYLANQFESIIDHMPGLVFYKDRNNCFVSVNKYVADAHKMTKAEMTGMNLNKIYPDEVALQYYQDDLEVINSGEAKLNITEQWNTDEGVRWVSTSKIPFVNDNGEILGIIGMSFDITDRVLAQEEIRILQKTVEQAPDAIVLTEPDGTICYVNRAFVEVTGYTQEEAIGQNPRILKDNRDAKVNFPDMWEKIISGKEWHGVFQNRKKDGSEYWERASISPLYDDDGNLIKFIGIKTDITREHKNEIEIERLYRTDMLTNVNNRRGFFELAEKELLRSQRYPQESSLLMLDIDYFKRINDEYGHNVGDQALREFAAVCADSIRATDIIGRIGGEEFAIYLVNMNLENAYPVAERIRRKVEQIELLDENGHKVEFTVSVGVTEITPFDHKLDQILKRADVAMYQAKNMGRNRVEIGS